MIGFSYPSIQPYMHVHVGNTSLTQKEIYTCELMCVAHTIDEEEMNLIVECGRNWMREQSDNDREGGYYKNTLYSWLLFSKKCIFFWAKNEFSAPE